MRHDGGSAFGIGQLSAFHCVAQSSGACATQAMAFGACPWHVLRSVHDDMAQRPRRPIGEPGLPRVSQSQRLCCLCRTSQASSIRASTDLQFLQTRLAHDFGYT